MQAVLYGDLDMRDVRNPDILWIFLVTRRGLKLKTLTHTLHVAAWPSAQTRTYLVSRVLARMDNLRSLSPPCFDLHILRHYSAFGLYHIEFGNTRLSGQAEAELLAGLELDAQTNVVCLRFLFCSMTMTARHHLHFLRPLCVPAFSPRPLHQADSIFHSFAVAAQRTPASTPHAFTQTGATLFPHLTTLQGPPRLDIFLVPS
ncbi:hypothetical protein ARMGADRAFT_117815 [Armillaria gallica]|uniref:Uncharacterized protein n=1 Tax=Armillaria gallica TaxID=47427 RepID=A0A2H3C9E8_ARMGA|nr:hypothetical protein ARMGADRAFT_117815 [Armillaria gallica]